MKGLKKKQKGAEAGKGNLTRNLKVLVKKMILPGFVKEHIVKNQMDASTEWVVPKKTIKNFASKPKKEKPKPPAEILAGNSGNSNSTARLYIRFPKSLESMNLDRNQLLSFHPDIVDVRIPRKKLHSKWFLACFKSEDEALAAKQDLIAKGGCIVMAQFGKEEREKRKKTPKTGKQSLIRDWTLEEMDVAGDDV